MQELEFWTKRYPIRKIAVVRSQNNKLLFGVQPTKRSLASEKKIYALAKYIYEIQYNNQIKTSSIEKAFALYYTKLS